ncbi:MAG: D-alanine--D-alanine ligase [Clostridia bacterium]|nr:D-alanine--D-alanine ligase [Clostridia bacterium]
MKIKVGVLFGGKSTEHEISIISAIQAINHLDKTKYDVMPIYITKNNEFYVGEGIGDIKNYTKLDALLKESQKVILVNEGSKVNVVRYPLKKFGNNVLGEIDVMFPIVHGTNVEDGTLQGYLSMLNIPYVGCDVTSSAVGMDKYVMKTVLKENGIPVLDCLRFTSVDYDYGTDAIIAKVEDKIGYPVIVKPVNLGSSIGITKAADKEELLSALDTAFGFADVILIERAITALKEINCAVLGDYTDAQASECEEPVNATDILTFKDKYMSGGKGSKGSGMANLSRKIPADITEEKRDEIRKMAVDAFKCLGCNGVTRIDFMIDTSTDTVYLNEVNTIPGSLSFYLWEPVGLPYAKLLDNMINLAFKRQREQSELTFSFDSNVLEGVNLGGAKGAKGSKM